MLDDVVLALNEHTVDQVAGQRMKRAAVANQRVLARALREQYLRPITEIARAYLADAPAIDKALKLPPYNLRPLKLVPEAMRDAAASYEARFVGAGMAPEFLKELGAAIDSIVSAMSGKAQSLGRHVGGRAGIERKLGRARQVLTGLDAIVKRAFRDRSDVLERWRITKRLHGIPGGNGGVSDLVVGEIAPPTPVLAAKLTCRAA